MFPELNNLLNTTPDRAEQGKLTLLCDAKTDGSFLVHHFLSFYLKANCKVCFVALIQSFSHYNIVGQKLGVSLTTARERGQLVFLEGLKSSVDVFFRAQEEPHPLQFLREANAETLQPLYEFVREALKPVDSGETAWRYPVLLVDDLSVLLSLGVGVVAVLDFVHYCRATVCWELKGNMVALVHDSVDTEDEENDVLLNGLSHQSHLILRAEGLATGFCRDVHGQLTILWRRALRTTAQREQILTYQYKIQDKNVSFFARGMSPAVL
ncbi:elongator complex protein 6 isoform X1 [Elephas maximus indicus]|uniref:elongator complex protein 6 isoform X1 n=1 Tax=Elephas maximus indicus TaxID=99487 RepID=UPI002115F9AF|nr:elongator complex protein 6 isoform X1 [Elephas maximus indicus]